MRLKEIGVKNFRGYREEVRVPIHSDVTGITGRNDAGKSSLLDALDIFFEGGEVSIDKDDFNVHERDGVIEIRCVFDQLPATISIDETNATTLESEHLLNQNGDLEILKRFKKGGKSPDVLIVAEHPCANGFDDLHSLKIADLKARAATLQVPEESVQDKRKSACWRSAIWALQEDLEKASRELKVSEFSDDSKAIQAKLFRELPLFALFKADRESKDSDPHAKNPLQDAVSQAKRELSAEIERLEQEIKARVLDRAQRTLEKLKEMDPNLAAELNPRFKKAPTWSFDFALDGDDEIPINKRGSGVRRLIVLNFFRAEAERKVIAEDAPAVIYGFEEPETSQHPANQELLVQALIHLGQRPASQVLLTTHVPALAGLLPLEGLRLVSRENGQTTVEFGTDAVLERIAKALGVLPDPGASRAKALLLVEGPGDVVFVRHLSKSLTEGGFLPKTLEDAGVLPVSIGGCGNLKHWQTKKLADQFGIPWAILLDSDRGGQDEGRNRKAVENLIAEGKKAFLTRRREPENYILPEVVQPFVKVGGALAYGETDDAKRVIGIATVRRQEEVLERYWPLMTVEQIRAVERHLDEDNEERFEFTELLSEVLALVE